MSKPKDSDELVVNPVTGSLDTVRNFNPDRILTADNNTAGNPLVTYDPASGQYTPSGSVVVTDNNGNLVNSK